ncbi:Arabinose 5-phosphate isomerase KpsF [invertebrate metagenome]|uniref:Arabinose 5-phosphate isomerase KpsF n=1 Tax=invertebrate metagenome TaxID=1711999 RepID=A0A2H9TA02_9ZZZZ
MIATDLADYTMVMAQSIKDQAKELVALGNRVNHTFQQAVEMILNCKGRVIISGMGKSGLIGKKIAATLASTGTYSFFMHPGEAFHGDLGMVRTDNLADIIILISYSGETDEVLKLIPSLQNFGTKIIAITGGTKSSLAKNADVVLDGSVSQEVCPNNLAPTSSTTVTLAIGDALAVALVTARNFKSHDFARFHPGGSLGRRLLTQVKDVMNTGKLPFIARQAPFNEVVMVMTSCRMGIALVMEDECLLGIITDGDLRRYLTKNVNLTGVTAGDLMASNPVCLSENSKLAEAETIMRDKRIKCLVAKDNSGKVTGLLDWAD